MFLNRLPMITESEGPMLMTYSWTLLAPRCPWEYTKQMQEGNREGGGRGRRMQVKQGLMRDKEEAGCVRME